MYELLVAIASAFIGFFVGRIDNFFNHRFDAYRERIMKFYQPLYIAHMRETRGCAYDFLDLPKHVQLEICNLMIDNAMYADADIQDTITEFVWLATDEENNRLIPEDIALLNKDYRILLDRASDERTIAMSRLLEPTLLDFFKVAFKRSVNPENKNTFNEQTKRNKKDKDNDERPGPRFLPW